MFIYDVVLADDEGTILATCPDLPEVASVGDDADEALANVLEAIELAIQYRIAQREPVPAPSRHRKGRHPVRLPAQAMAKVLLHNEMLAQNVRKAELARRLGVHLPQVDRLLNPRHASRLEMIEAALEAVGRHLDLRVA